MSAERSALERAALAELADDALTTDPEAQPCQKAAVIDFDAYRIGRGPRRPHWAHRWHVDRWFRSWQGEWEVLYGIVTDHCASCPRAWTRKGAIRKAKRWYRRGTDIGRARRNRPWRERIVTYRPVPLDPERGEAGE